MSSIYEILVGIILLGTLVLIMSEKIDKTLGAMLGAGLALLIAITPGSAGGDKVIIPNVEHLFEFLEIDLILVIIGITLMVGTARSTGLFDYIALVVLKKAGYNQFRLLTALSLLTMVFSAFLDAYMAILIVGSITLVSCESLEINPKPYILACAVFGNLGGTMTRIASPPNLIIGSHFDVDFVLFFVLTTPYVLIVAFVTLLLWRRIFYKDLSKPISKYNYNELLLIEERTVITNQKNFNIAAIIILLTTVGFILASFLPIKAELGYIAMAGGFSMVGCIKADVHEAVNHIEWPLIFFLVGLLTVIGISEEIGVLEFVIIPIERLFAIDEVAGIFSLLWLNTFASAFLDNVAMASIMTNVMDQLIIDYPGVPFEALLVSVVIGTNLGGNLTPIGSASTVQAFAILEKTDKKEFRCSFLQFFKIGMIIIIPQLLIGTVYVFLIYFIWMNFLG